jgi:hypothetical protein
MLSILHTFNERRARSDGTRSRLERNPSAPSGQFAYLEWVSVIAIVARGQQEGVQYIREVVAKR